MILSGDVMSDDILKTVASPLKNGEFIIWCFDVFSKKENTDGGYTRIRTIF